MFKYNTRDVIFKKKKKNIYVFFVPRKKSFKLHSLNYTSINKKTQNYVSELNSRA